MRGLPSLCTEEPFDLYEVGSQPGHGRSEPAASTNFPRMDISGETACLVKRHHHHAIAFCPIRG